MLTFTVYLFTRIIPFCLYLLCIYLFHVLPPLSLPYFVLFTLLSLPLHSHLKPFPHISDHTTFYGILVGHIYRLLKEREELYCDSNWVCQEAMKRTSLRNGGTFKNALVRRLDDVVVPIFTEVIAFIDCNYNLNFLQPVNSSAPLSHLWLKIFCCPAMEHKLSYQRMKIRQKVLIDEFEGQFPFSWLVKEAIDNLWEEAKAIAGHINVLFVTVSQFLLSISVLSTWQFSCNLNFVVLFQTIQNFCSILQTQADKICGSSWMIL